MKPRSPLTSSSGHQTEVGDVNLLPLRAFQNYVRGLSLRNPSLSAFSSFLANPKVPRSGCCATAVEFRAGVTCPGIRPITSVSCLRSEFNRTIGGGKETSRDEPDFQVQGRILIIEDLTVEVATILGTELDIDPMFLATHLHTVHRTGMRHQTPDDANLPSRYHKSNFMSIPYHQPVTCKGVSSSGARFMTDTAIDRKLVFLRATDIGLAQHRVSVIKLKPEGSFWLALVLVDPPLGNNFYRGRDHVNAGQHVRLDWQPYLGTYEDFMNAPPFSQSWKVPQYSERGGMLKDLGRYWERAIPQCFDATDPSIQSLAYYPLRIVAAEWVKYVEVMLNCIRIYEYQGYDIELERCTMALCELQGWRRRSLVSHRKIQAVIRHLRAHKSSQSEQCADVDLVRQDFESIDKDIEDAGRRLEDLLPLVTSLVQIIDARQSFAETANISRLTVLALIFVPLGYVSSLFSMNPANMPGSAHFWVYFAVAIPITLIVALIARPPTKDELQQILIRTRSAYQFVRTKTFMTASLPRQSAA